MRQPTPHPCLATASPGRVLAGLLATALLVACASTTVVHPPPAPIDPYGDANQATASAPLDHRPVVGERVSCSGIDDKFVVNTDTVIRDNEGKFFAFVCPPKPKEAPAPEQSTPAERW